MKPAQNSFAICSPHPICFIKQQYSLSHQHDLQITSRAGQACLLLQSGGFLAFTVAGRDMLSRQYLKGMLNNDLIEKRHNWVHLDIPQQMWGRQSIDRGPLVLLVINRQSMGDSALFRYKWGLLNGTAMTGYACVKTKPQAEEKNNRSNLRGNSRKNTLVYTSVFL